MLRGCFAFCNHKNSPFPQPNHFFMKPLWNLEKTKLQISVISSHNRLLNAISANQHLIVIFQINLKLQLYFLVFTHITKRYFHTYFAYFFETLSSNQTIECINTSWFSLLCSLNYKVRSSQYLPLTRSWVLLGMDH